MKYIYALTHPVTNEVRYIGQTTNPIERLKNHLRKSYRPKQHSQCWIKSLLNENLKPKLVVLVIVEDSDWEYYEREVIKLYNNLTNRTSGGLSVWWNDLTKEEREKFRHKMKLVNNKTNRISPEGRKRMSEAAIRTHTGRKCTDNHKRTMSEKMTGSKNHRFGKEVSQETRLKLSKARTGRKHTDESKALMKEVQKNLNGISVDQFDLEGNYLQTFETVINAAMISGAYHSNIIACCKGRLKKTGGFIWKYSKGIDKN